MDIKKKKFLVFIARLKKTLVSMNGSQLPISEKIDGYTLKCTTNQESFISYSLLACSKLEHNTTSTLTGFKNVSEDDLTEQRILKNCRTSLNTAQLLEFWIYPKVHCTADRGNEVQNQQKTADTFTNFVQEPGHERYAKCPLFNLS
jgi:hypothetical protein